MFFKYGSLPSPHLHDLHRLSVPKFEKGVNGVVLVPLSQRLFGAAEAIPSLV
jgi:hypothetical protein